MRVLTLHLTLARCVPLHEAVAHGIAANPDFDGGGERVGLQSAAHCETVGTDTYCTWNYRPISTRGHVCGYDPPTGGRTPHHVKLYDNNGELLFVWAAKGLALRFPKGTGIPFDNQLSTIRMVAHYRTWVPWIEGGETVVRMRVCDGDAAFVPHVEALVEHGFTIPAGQSSYIVRGTHRMRHHGRVSWFRVHAHALGVRNKAAMRHGVVERSTRLPQSFVAVERPFDVQRGESVHFECEYDSTTRQRPTRMGSTHRDEMCNVYLMLVVPNDQRRLQTTVTRYPLGAGERNEQVVAVAASDARFWTLTRGERIWDGGSFDRHFRYMRPPLQSTALRQMGTDGIDVDVDLPHGLSWDADHRRLLLVDGGRHQVLIIDPTSGAVEQRLGAGFCQPTDARVWQNRMYVADGYCNSRVVEFKRRAPGSPWTQSRVLGQGHFRIPHALAMVGGEVCVADREHDRVVCCTQTERCYVRASLPGPVYGLTRVPSDDSLLVLYRMPDRVTSKVVRCPARHQARCAPLGGTSPYGHAITATTNGTVYVASCADGQYDGGWERFQL